MVWKLEKLWRQKKWSKQIEKRTVTDAGDGDYDDDEENDATSRAKWSINDATEKRRKKVNHTQVKQVIFFRNEENLKTTITPTEKEERANTQTHAQKYFSAVVMIWEMLRCVVGHCM